MPSIKKQAYVVAARFIQGKEFSSPEKLKEYLRDHPGADPKKHKVKRLPALSENQDGGVSKDVALQSGRAVKQMSSLKSKVDKANTPKERRALLKSMTEHGDKLIHQSKRLLETLSGEKADKLKKALADFSEEVAQAKKRAEDKDSTHANLQGDARNLAVYSERLKALL